VPAGAGICQPAASRRPQRGRRRALRAADQNSRRRAFGFVKAAYTVDETLDPLSIVRTVPVQFFIVRVGIGRLFANVCDFR
jgi:hypothetical protein